MKDFRYGEKIPVKPLTAVGIGMFDHLLSLQIGTEDARLDERGLQVRAVTS
ncbi:MAG TPA: hypothetical protein VKH81_14690 [Candidatus Angelobacter sp.]|nr:hypothetical protein [Candidatus Angelobacter sp.]